MLLCGKGSRRKLMFDMDIGVRYDCMTLYLISIFFFLVDIEWKTGIIVECNEADGFHLPVVFGENWDSIQQNDLLLLSRKKVSGVCQILYVLKSIINSQNLYVLKK